MEERGEGELAEHGMQEGESDLDRLQPPYTEEILGDLKRRKLQFLCKRHNVKCSGKNAELIGRLLQVNQLADDAPVKSAPPEQIWLNVKESEPSLAGMNEGEPAPTDEREDGPTPTKAIAPSKISGPAEEAPPVGPKTHSAPTNSTGLRVPSQPGRRTTAAPRPPTLPMSTIQTAGRKKFDLKESLKRPLGYVPHRGPLKPFSAPPPNP